MKVIKRINNNVVLVNDSGKKLIVTGKGVGFKVYPDDVVNQDFIEQRFVLQEDQDADYYVQLLREIPMECLTAARKVVEMAESELNKPLSMNLVFALADHINFALERIKKGMIVEHPLAWEIRQFYPKEMQIGLNALELLQSMMDIELPETEAVFITMHLVNTLGGFSETYDITDLTAIMSEIIKDLESFLNIQIDQSSAAFVRFITHLRYYLIRQLNFEIDESINDELLVIVKEKYPIAFECAQRIANRLDANNHVTSSESEKLYLTLHINRLISTNRSEENDK